MTFERNLPPAEIGSRELFPDLEARVYVNHASCAPLSTPVLEAIHDAGRRFARNGLAALLDARDRREALRANVARLIGARAEDVAFVASTTQAIVDIALCFPWTVGDRIVLFEGEFPTNVTPWQRAAELFGLEVVMLPAASYLEDETAALQRLSSELERGVRLVAVSEVEFQTGYRMPVAEIARLAHAAGGEVFVDAIQACGIVPIDVASEDADYLVSGAHKWLMAGDGIAFIYAKAERAAALRPHVAGWLSHEDAATFLFHGSGHLRYDRPIRSSIDFLESGSSSTWSIAALEASLGILLRLTPEAILAHVERYHDALEPKLEELGFRSLRSRKRSSRSGTLSFEPPSGVFLPDLSRALTERSIACAIPDGLLRISPHWPNAIEEVEVLVEAVRQSLREA
jgi:cysteine desulfurase/selenocysteine lyase